MKRCVIAAGIAAALSCPLHAAAQPTDQWRFSLTPYVWLPSFETKLRYGPPPPGGSSANVEVSTEDFLDKLNFAFLLAGEARKNRWLIATDFIYMDLGSESSDVRSVDFNPGPGPINIATTQLNAGTRTALDAVVWSLVGGYNLVQDAGNTLDAFAGFRYAGVSHLLIEGQRFPAKGVDIRGLADHSLQERDVVQNNGDERPIPMLARNGQTLLGQETRAVVV